MNQQWNGIERRKSLREKAVAMVASLSPEEKPVQPAETLLHELLVHKIELEMQNDELQKAHIALQEARDRYQELYEFSPTSNLIIDSEGLISDINLTGAALLGKPREQLINLQFSMFVDTTNHDLWQRRFQDFMTASIAQKQSFDLEMVRLDATLFRVHFNGLRRDSPTAPPQLLVTLVAIDILV